VILRPLVIAAFVGSGSASSTPKTKHGIAALSSQVKRVVKDNNLELATQRTVSCESAHHRRQMALSQFNISLRLLGKVLPLPPRTGVHARNRACGPDQCTIESCAPDVGV
jgi:hypothetical protein